MSRGHTYIDRPSPCHVSFRVGTAPISIGHYHVSLSRGCTYIDRPSPCHTSLCFWDRTYIDRSLSCQFESGPHLYQSVISLSCQFEFSLSWGRNHIDRPFSYQFVFSLSRDRTHIDRSFILLIKSIRRSGLCFSVTFRVTFPDLAFRGIVHTHPNIFVSHHVSSILGI